MTVNVGSVDRVLRALLGLVLLWLAFFSGYAAFAGGFLKYAAVIVGIVMLATAVLRICPLYSVFGIKTCKVN